jgi:hypothetical protein
MAASPDPSAREAWTSLFGRVSALLRELPGLFSDRVDLFTLELQRAATALAQIVALVVAVAILGVTMWLVLWGAIVAGLMAAGLHLGWALLVVLVMNALPAWLLVVRIRRLLPRVSLPATRRQLTFRSAADTAPPLPGVQP